MVVGTTNYGTVHIRNVVSDMHKQTINIVDARNLF